MKRGYQLIIICLFFISIIFTSSCEVFTPGGNSPQLSYPRIEGEDSLQLPLPEKFIHHVLTTICENAFYGSCNNPSGNDILVTHCSNSLNLGCSGSCYVSIDSDSCGMYDPGLGNCYCIGDGICHSEYGEPSSSLDCQDCVPGETEACTLPQAPGTCGLCNAGLRTCDASGFWGSCDQVVFPIQENCNNGLDDDCDCNSDAVDPDCVYTHLECGVGGTCINVSGPGPNQDNCTIVGQTCGFTPNTPNWLKVYPPALSWGNTTIYPTCQEECIDAGYGGCVANDSISGQCNALVFGSNIIRGAALNSRLTGYWYNIDSANSGIYSFSYGRTWCCCENAPTTQTFCGDGVIQTINQEGMYEYCDSPSFGSNTCASLGYGGGSLACEPYNCRLDKSGCIGTCRNADNDGYYHNAVNHTGNQLYEVHHTDFMGNPHDGSAQFTLPAGYYSFKCSAAKSFVAMYNGSLLGDGFWGPYPTENNTLVDSFATCDCQYDYGAFEMPGTPSDNHYIRHNCSGQTMEREIIKYLPAGNYSIYVAPPIGVFAPSDYGSYGRLSQSRVSCTGAIDCDDDSAGIKPNAVENLANSIDDNCDGLIDVA